MLSFSLRFMDSCADLEITLMISIYSISQMPLPHERRLMSRLSERPHSPTISTLQLPLQFLHLLMPFVNLLPVHPATRRHLVLKFLKFVPSRRVRKFVSILEIIEETSRGVLAWKRKEMRRALREGGEAEAGLYYLGEGEGVKGTRVMKKGGRDVLSVLCESDV